MVPKAKIKIGNNSRLVINFSLLKGFAKITHEAVIGQVDKKQVEILMARGPEQEQAVDLIISGMLK
ncbi:MAG: hypothetical protein ACUVQ3_09795 [bacterium]